MGEFEGRVALVTGAAGDGIGQATARRLATDGATVAVTDIHAERTRKVTESLRTEFGDRVAGYPMDVSDREHVDGVLAEVTRDLGPIDILILNAASNVVAPFSQIDPADWDRVMAVNYRGGFYLTRQVLASMIERRSGNIVFVTAIAAYTAANGREPAYSSASSAIHAMMRAAAFEGGPHGVRCNAVAPGVTWSRFVRQRIEKFKTRAEQTPLGRLGEPEEVANVIKFLCSKESSYITGESINVSGGFYMRP